MNPVAEIRSLARQLTLTNLAQRQFDFLSEPVSNEQFLLDCLRGEVAYREQKAQERRIKQAQIPTFKDFDSFDTDFQQGLTPWQLQQLANLNWIEGVYNLILIGPGRWGTSSASLGIPVRAGRIAMASAQQGNFLSRMVGGPIAVARRGGVTSSIQEMMMFFLSNDMVVPGSTYWNIVFGQKPGDALFDEEGISTIRRFGENVAFLVKKINE